MIIIKIIKICLKGDLHAITSVFQCGRRIFNIKSMECHHFGLVYTLSVFVIISFFG